MAGKRKTKKAVFAIDTSYKTGKVTVPIHSGDIPKGTLHAIKAGRS